MRTKDELQAELAVIEADRATHRQLHMPLHAVESGVRTSRVRTTTDRTERALSGWVTDWLAVGAFAVGAVVVLALLGVFVALVVG